jgi:hypothetical protein
MFVPVARRAKVHLVGTAGVVVVVVGGRKVDVFDVDGSQELEVDVGIVRVLEEDFELTEVEVEDSVVEGEVQVELAEVALDVETTNVHHVDVGLVLVVGPIVLEGGLV